MRLASAEDWTLPAGTLHLARPVPAADGPAPRPAALSLNQRNHLAALAGGGASVWLALAAELPAAVDAARLGELAGALVARHSALQLSAGEQLGAELGLRHHPDGLRPQLSTVRTTGAEETRRRLLAFLQDACRPRLGAPGFALAALVHEDGTTLVCAFDHFHVDAASLPLLLDDAVALLGAPGASRPLPEPGCFATRASQWAAAPRIAADDDRLHRWYELMDTTGDRLPTFPLPLGLAEGEVAPHRSTFAALADAATADALGTAGSVGGASTAALCLTAFANAVRRLGGPDTLPVLVPVQTRTAGDDRAVGWFTTTVPVLLHTDAATFSPDAVAAALARGTAAADLPLDQVLASLRRPLARARDDVFMLSYLDYRRVPGHDTARALDAVQVSAPTDCDDLQAWVARTGAGLQVRLRHPDTPTARRTVAGLLDAWTAEVAGLATGVPSLPA